MRLSKLRAIHSLTAVIVFALGGFAAPTVEEATVHSAAERVGPPTLYSPPVDRFRFWGSDQEITRLLA